MTYAPVLGRQTEAEAQKPRSGAESVAIQQACLTFLEQNKSKLGVLTTTSGLQYRVIEAGGGAARGPDSTVTVNYRGTTVDGNLFDSSYRRGQPATFGLGNVIKGWTECLRLIKESGKSEFYIPMELA